MSIKNKINDKTLLSLKKITGGELTLGKFIWSIRECEDLSQTEFAEKLGISKQHLCDLEHDRKNIRPKLAAEYAKKLGYAPEQFIQLALQNTVNRDGLKVIVKIISKLHYVESCA
ncbi:MAG: helix-turn-helix transcriptional regulator [Gammaproteobacteria bacterium]